MKNSITLNWLESMAFETELQGHKITIDASPEAGGQSLGPTPKPLMLVALAGCTAMDVVSILKKMRVEPDDFKVSVEADGTDEHPKHYTRMHIVYDFYGQNLPLDKIEKAIDLSQERYCGVSAAYKKAMEISWEIRINPA